MTLDLRAPMLKLLTNLLVVLTALAVPILSPAKGVDVDYSNRPVRLVVPFAPGGMSDSMGRLIAQHLTAEFKKPVVVDNRPDVINMIAARAASATAPDGYTLLLANNNPLAVSPTSLKNHVDHFNGFTPISLITTNLFLATNEASGYESVEDVVRDAKK